MNRIVAVLGFLVVIPSAGWGQTCPVPTLVSVEIDGTFDDWSEVFSNPSNTSRDANGSTVQCSLSTDLDCSMGVKHDLTRFAWTSDAARLSLSFERQSTSGSVDFFFAYLDLGHDGLMGSGDLVLVVTLNTDSAAVAGDVMGYAPADPSGDPLVDASGVADGWTMPGGVLDIGRPGRVTGSGPGAGAAAYEVGVAWNDLGVVAGSPLLMHVSLGSTTSLPSAIKDNMGGMGGGAVDAAFRSVSIGPERTLGAAPGSTARFDHLVANSGNLADRIDLAAVASAGHDIEWRADLDVDGVHETFMAFDAGGDGILTLPGDFLTAGGDSNGDWLLDLGVVGANASVAIQLGITVPAGAGGVTETIDVAAWTAGDAACRASISDLLRIGDVTLARDERRLGVPGQAAWIPHVVQNNLGIPAVVGFSAISVRSWPYAFFADPDEDGGPADAVPLTDTDSDGRPDITLAPGETAHLLVRASVPAGAPLGQTETVFVRAHLGGTPASAVTDRVTLGNPLVLAPSYLLADGAARYGVAGGSIYYAHRLINGCSAQDQFELSAASDLGWPVTLLSDPDGDGRPYDSLPMPQAPVAVSVNGGELPFIVRVDIPSGARLGDLSVLTIEARGASDPSVLERVQDEAVVAIVRVFDEPGRVASVTSLPPCGVAYCFASGLPPGAPDYQFEWRDGSGSVVRTVPASTSAQGDCSDQLTLGPADAGAGWSVAIQHFELGAWVAQDIAYFRIGDDLEADALITDSRSYDLRATSISAVLDVANRSFDSPITGQSLRWAVLTPDTTQVLLGNGAWTAWTGVEATRMQALDLLAGETRSFAMTVGGISFPAAGRHDVLVYRSSPCGTGDSLLVGGAFLVIDDQDGDGLSVEDEVTAGTDPADADSDDDGVPDGADGLGDADGDGLADALDCDSDDDGLPDGVESGLVVAGSATNVARGCFRADADPTTTTDPDAADTDRGGIPDGAEDPDGDGARGPGEPDPLDATDDATLDGDADTLPDLDEAVIGTDPLDPDTDDDGVADGLESWSDGDGDGLPSVLDCDADGDGLPDGLETGVSSARPGTDVAAGCFAADQDPATRTDPERADTDGGGVSDGAEDGNGNGALDAGERDPLAAADDSCSVSPPGEILDLRVRRSGDVAILTWTAIADACATYVVEYSEALPSMSDLATGLPVATFSDSVPLAGASLRCYLIAAESALTGRGPDGL